jgi:DNA-binding FadR family transcriptional regulator
MASTVVRRRPAIRSAADRDGRSSKAAERLAERIERTIVARQWPVGAVLGSELALIERYRVSRAVLREAARILEHHGTARMRRGPGGGLVVTRPNPSAVVRAAALYLDFERATAAQLSDVRIVVELAAVERAAQRIDESGIERLRAGLARERARIESDEAPEEALHELHVLIAELAGNAVLPLFVRVLTKVMEQHFAPRRPSTKELATMVARVHRSHEKIVEALVRGDVGIARYRMQRDLEAITPYLC